MELKVFWVTAFADTLHLGMLVAAENKEGSLELAQDRVKELIYDCPSLAGFRDANYMAEESDTTQKNVQDLI